MDRFIVEQQKSKAFMVKDTMANTLKQPTEMAVAIYFKHQQRAAAICNIMNAEWSEFEANPQ